MDMVRLLSPRLSRGRKGRILASAVVGRQVLIAIAEVVLAELTGGVPLVLNKPGDRRVEDVNPLLGARQPDFGQVPRLLFRVEVVEVAEELVEAVVGRQVLIAVAEVVIAELAGRVALVL